MKKLLTTATLITTLGIAPFIAFSAFAQAPVVSPTPVQHYNQAVISWQTQPNTKCYRIYYKETPAPKWQHSVRCSNLPATSFQYTIQYLKRNTSYTYNVVAVGFDKKETFLGNKQMITSPMAQ